MVILTSEAIKNLLYGLKVIKAFKDADENPTIRQLYEISHLKENKNRHITIPDQIHHNSDYQTVRL